MGYCDTIVTYIDVLGFRDLIKASERDPQGIDNITNILGATERKGGYKTLLEEIPEFTQNVERRRHTFSDLVVRTTSLEGAFNKAMYLFYELEALIRIQWELLVHQDALIRGGVCIKNMNRHGYLFGPGLVRAYELAEKMSVFPRIIINADLTSLIKATPIPWLELLGQGEDGQYFVDYLKATLKSSRHRADTIKNAAEHKKCVLRKLKTHKKDERVRQKLVWLALYHNRTIDYYIDTMHSAKKGLIVSMRKDLNKQKIDEQNI